MDTDADVRALPVPKRSRSSTERLTIDQYELGLKGKCYGERSPSIDKLDTSKKVTYDLEKAKELISRLKKEHMCDETLGLVSSMLDDYEACSSELQKLRAEIREIELKLKEYINAIDSEVNDNDLSPLSPEELHFNM